MVSVRHVPVGEQTLSIKSVRERLLASTMICGAAVAMLGVSQAAAQTAPAPAAPDEQTAVEEIVVTGSLFRRTDTETPSPVTVLTSENLQRAGITTATDAIRSISADGAGSIGTGFQSGFSAGGSAVSLRGLGVSSTLVLIDGLRSANFPINDDGHNAYVDLNSIPFSLIERIEVLKDGASSSYGADAIGGVVNLILKKQFEGISGSAEWGQSQERDARHQAFDLTLGYGNYAEKGWNIYINGEYQKDGRVTNHSRGFPYNTQDLRPIGGLDNNTADSSLTTATPHAVVVRTTQSDLNNPLSGGLSPFTIGTGSSAYSEYTSLGLGTCLNGTYTVTTGGARGTGCRYNLVDLYNQIAPKQERYAVNGRLSFRFNDNVEGYVTGSYSRDLVSIKNQPRALRNTQPFGGSPALASTNPGIVLPVYVCSSGVNCSTAGDRRLNPNNPYAAAYANDPSNGAARIYYLFGDIPAGSDRTNEVFRATTGLKGSFGDDWNWQLQAAGAKDKLKIEQYGFLNIANLLQSINTGSYDFVNPGNNTATVRNFISPTVTTPSHSTMLSLDGSITKSLWTLPGGDMQLALGAQIRKEKLENNNQNAKLDTYSLTTSSAFGEHTVKAGYFELLAPVLNQLEINVSGRYDDYSEGFSHFSPKVGAKFTPMRQLAFRGTYSKGFRAPTFAESGARSQYAGFSTFTPAAVVPERARRPDLGRQHQPVRPSLLAGRRLCRQPGPEAREVAQLHPGRDRRADSVAQHDRRLLQREEVGPDRGRSSPRRRAQRLLHRHRRDVRLRRRRRHRPRLFVQPDRRDRPAVPERPAPRADHQRAVRERRLLQDLGRRLLGDRSRQPALRRQADQPHRSHPRAAVRPAHRQRRPEVRRHAGPVPTVFGQRHAGLAR
jgi:iron complex outermembrane receptor protein